MNFGQLKTKIGNHLHRTDLAAIIPDFVIYAESVISSTPTPSGEQGLIGVRTRSQKVRTTFTVDSEYETLPTNLISLRKVQINTTPITTLQYLTPQQLTEKYPSNPAGTPLFYTVQGDEIQFAPTPGQSMTGELFYTSKFDALSADDDTNWLLTNHPLIYVYAACIAGASYIEADPTKFINLYNTLAKGLNEAELDTQQATKLVTRPRTATP